MVAKGKAKSDSVIGCLLQMENAMMPILVQTLKKKNNGQSTKEILVGMT